MKWVVIGAIVVIGGVVLAVFLKSKSSPTGTSDKRPERHPNPVPPLSDKADRIDEVAIEGLPEQLKAIIVEGQGSLPTKLSPSWLENDLRDICLGDSKLVREVVVALIASSKGGLMAAASVGEENDVDRMVPNKELPAGHRVAKLVCPGIRRTVTGEVLMKAVVE